MEAHLFEQDGARVDLGFVPTCFVQMQIFDMLFEVIDRDVAFAAEKPRAICGAVCLWG